MNNEIYLKKKKLREILTSKREEIKKKTNNYFNIKKFEELQKKLDFQNINKIASFVSIKSEIPTKDLNEHILKLNKILSFPQIVFNSETLTFREYDKKDRLFIGKYNIPEPGKSKNEVIPELIFVPCLGFDLNGYRLGYGGGYYDKTFEKLKKNNLKFYSVGFAFDNQLISKLPTSEFDYKLDYVLTEKCLYSF